MARKKLGNRLMTKPIRSLWVFVPIVAALPSAAIAQNQETNAPRAISPAEDPESGPRTIHNPETCSQCQNGKTCVPGMPDYPAFQNTFGNPQRIWDCRNDSDCQPNLIDRWKRSLQASHWGYPEYFHRNSYGLANRIAFANNIKDGAIERSTIYSIDFYPEDSAYAHMLTPRGIERLEKALCVSTTLGSPIRIEKSVRPELNELRRQWIAEHPVLTASGIDPDRMQWVSKPVGIQAVEAIRSYQRGISASPGQPSTGSNSTGSIPFNSGNSVPMGLPR